MRVLYLATSGSADPTLASIPLHLAANGSAAIGQEASIVLLGDATELALPGVADSIEGVGLPPVRELLQKMLDQQIPVAI